MTGEVARFRALIADRLGLSIDEGRSDGLAELLERRASAARASVGRYLDELADPRGDEELAAIAPDFTVGETYFFRHAEQLRALLEVAVPERRAASGGRALSILSAGCASGEEPYTLAMMLRAEGDEPRAAIRAVDVSRPSLAKARRARYGTWALRETSDALRDRFFRPVGRELELHAEIREMVRFEERNLAAPGADLFAPGSYDIILCRNVLMYFAESQARALVERFASALAPDGFLFLGHAETLRGLSTDFHLRHTNGAFFYQRRLPTERTTAVPLVVGRARELPSLEASTSWVDAIRRASDRVAALAARSSADGVARVAAPAPSLGATLELVSRERFADALAALGELPHGAEQDADVILLRAALLAHSGALAESEAACRALLVVDELSAGAHYVLALCREAGGDPHGAMEHDRVAAYLDPSFAMPHLHLGLAARRAGDHELARGALATAIELLAREDASRVLLFGGGFDRDTLVALCRAELRACGAAG